MFSAAVKELVDALPSDVVITDPQSLEKYRWDRSEDPQAILPVAAVRAENTEQVQAAVRIAAKAGLPVIPRGAGSGLSAGATSSKPALVISLERMREIEIDPATKIARVQPGLMNAEVKQAAAEHGLWYPPDPSSFEFCSIGGNIATNAGGLCCVKYGVTVDYVLGLTVVLADGRAVTLGGPRVKDVAGLSLTKLFVGSEGTLGIVTEALLRLIPAQGIPTTVVAVFPDMQGATDAVITLTRSMRPSMLELMDRVAIEAVENEMRMGLDREAAAMLIMQFDEGGAAAGETAESICLSHGATECYATDDPEEGESFTVARRAALPALEKVGRLLIDDVGVPIPRLGELAAGIERIAETHRITVSLIAHAGDGNTHPTIVFDRDDPEQELRAVAAYNEIMDLAIDLDGTITGEHGVGRLKAPWLRKNIGEDVYELNLRIKEALDPQGILNPGAKFEIA